MCIGKKGRNHMVCYSCHKLTTRLSWEVIIKQITKALYNSSSSFINIDSGRNAMHLGDFVGETKRGGAAHPANTARLHCCLQHLLCSFAQVSTQVMLLTTVGVHDRLKET
eukprot:8469077-Ditylum_brightwellii.AAC.1